MKTSTKNVIITGIFTVIAAVIGRVSFSIGKTTQNKKIETTINQSGVITINQNENLAETIDCLLDKYLQLQSDYNSISVKFKDLETDYSAIQKENNNLNGKVKILESENTSLNNKLAVQKSLEDNTIPEISSNIYLFDSDPFMVENVKIYMRNNDKNTIHSYSNYFYNTDYIMTSNGIKYYKGMAITVDSLKQSIVYYNLEKKYLLLSGLVAFEDEHVERADKNYEISFYADNNFIDTFIINKGELPTEFSIDITNCSILKIMLESPSGDSSDNPDINLIDFKLYN